MTKLRIGLMAAALALGLPVLPAQQDSATQQQRMERAQQRLQEIKDRLKLTPEQEEQVKPIVMDEFQQLKAVRDKYAGDTNRRSRLKMAREMRDVQSDTENKLAKVLNKDQMAELKKMREQWRAQARDRMNKQ